MIDGTVQKTPANPMPALRTAQKQCPTVLGNNDIMPRSGLGLLLNTDNYDTLVETLTAELGPPNLLARQNIRLLAQEMAKLEFIQRVELSLMDSTQQIPPGRLNRLEERHKYHCGKKTVKECEYELQVLKDLYTSISEGRSPEVTDDLEWLTDRLWSRITIYEKSCRSLEKEIEEMRKEAPTVPEDEKEGFIRDWHSTEEELAENQAEDAKSGRATLGIDTQDDLAAVLSGTAPVPKDHADVWLSTLDTYIDQVQSNRLNAEDLAKKLAEYRNEAAQKTLYKLDQFAQVQRHSEGIRKNIDRCLRRLQMCGVNLKAAQACSLQCITEEVSQ